MSNQEFIMNAPKQVYEQREEDLVAPGQHIALLVRIIDLGKQWTENKWGKKFSPKLQLVFELPFEQKEFKEGEGQQPAWMYANFTFVISKNSLLKAFLDNVLQRNLAESEFDTFNIGELLGKTFIINVANTPKNDGKGVWQNISSATLIKGEEQRQKYNADWSKVVPSKGVFGFHVDDAGECFKTELFADFGSHMREKLLKSEQGQAFIASGGIPFAKDPNPKKEPVKASTNPLQQNTAEPVKAEVMDNKNIEKKPETPPSFV